MTTIIHCRAAHRSSSKLSDPAPAAETDLTGADTTDPPPLIPTTPAVPTMEPPHSVEYVQSERRNPNLLFNSHKYYFLRSVTDYSIWRCTKKDCHSFIRTASDKVIKETGTHNHEPLSIDMIKKLKLKAVFRKKAAKRPDEKPARLIGQVFAANKHVKGKTNNDDVNSYRRLIRRARRKLYKTVPKTKSETMVELRTLAEKGDELVRFVDKDVVMICREEDLKLLCRQEEITLFADGTFNYSPQYFKQMLSIFVFLNGFYIPICHFLLDNKLSKTYKHCVCILKEECLKLGLELNVANVMLDFEAGLIKAFKQALPTAQIQGCRFHLGQSWWRHIGGLGLAKVYKEASTRDGRWLRRCFSLKLLPASLVESVFEKSVKLGKLDRAKPFEEYLRAYYIKNDSPFPPSSWAGLKFKTTNNGAESFHRHFGDLFGYLHSKPDIWEFLRTMAIYNVVYKDTKIESKEKKSKKTSDFWSTPIKQYKDKEISVVKLLDSLSNRCQPKITSLKKKTIRKKHKKQN